MLNFHPMLVHFPVALFSAALFFDLAARLFRGKREILLETRWYTLLLALAGLVAAVASGLYAEDTIPHNEAIHELMQSHEKGMFAAAAHFAIAALWIYAVRKKKKAAAPWGATLFLAAGFGVMAWAADLGGQMVYEHGAGTSIPGLEIGEDHDHAGHSHDGHAHEHGIEMHDHDAIEGTGREEGHHRGGEEATHEASEEHPVHVHKDGSVHQH